MMMQRNPTSSLFVFRALRASRSRRMPQRLLSSAPSSNCDVVQGPSLLRTTVHRPRPSLLFLPGLRSLPFWTQWDGQTNRVAYNDPKVQRAVAYLEENCSTILQEYEEVATSMKSDYTADTEHQLHKGKWDWHSYMLKGQVQGHFAQHFPEVTGILQNLREEGMLFEGNPFGYCFFSTLHPHASINAHSAPMNLRLRVHLPLLVPKETASDERPSCGIRVGSVTRPWKASKALVFDDAYDHEVWNETDQKRVLLLVDLWHPDVTLQEREDIVGMFEEARKNMAGDAKKNSRANTWLG
jgi:hypothetical protein